MNFDFGTIKAWVSWPIDYFKDKWNQLSPEKRTVAAYALGVFSILSVVSYVYAQWKWSAKKMEANKDKIADRVHDNARILRKLKSTSIMVTEPIHYPPQVDERERLVKVPSPKVVVPQKNVLPKEEPKIKEDKKAFEVIAPKAVDKEKKDDPKKKTEAEKAIPPKNVKEEPKENFKFEGEREKEILKKGKLTLKDVVMDLVGEFKVQGDALTGKGKISFPNGVVFEGEYDKGVFKKGQLAFNQAEKILDKPIVKKPLTYVLDGEFTLSSTFFKGEGKVTFDENFENGIYEGGIVDGLCDSEVAPLKIIRGTLIIGKISFEGTFKKGISVGGVKIINGVSYEGEFPIEEKKNLIVTLPNKKTFVGSIIPSQGDGEGLMIDEDEVREGKFEKGKLVKGKTGLLKEPYTIKEGTFNDGVFLEGTIEEGKDVWKVKLQEDGFLKGTKTSETCKLRGFFDAKDYRFIEGVINFTVEKTGEEALPAPTQIQTKIGILDPYRGFYGFSKYTDGTMLVGANISTDEDYKVFYNEKDQSGKVGKMKGLRLERGILRDNEGQVQIGLFDQEEKLILGLKKPFNGKYEKFVDSTKKIDEEAQKWTFDTKTLPSGDKVQGWFDEKGVCQFGAYVDKVGGGIFDEKGHLFVGAKAFESYIENIWAIFESDLPVIGKWVKSNSNYLEYGFGVLSPDKKKYFGQSFSGDRNSLSFGEGIFGWNNIMSKPYRIQNGMQGYPYVPNKDDAKNTKEGFFDVYGLDVVE